MSWPPADRCAWSGERSPNVIRVELPGVDRFGRRVASVTLPVLPEHEAALRTHLDRLSRYGSRFLWVVVGLGLLAFLAAVAPALNRDWAPLSIPVAGVLLAIMGLLFVLLPFSTPETSTYFGLRRSIFLVRFLGVVLAALGVWIAVLA